MAQLGGNVLNVALPRLATDFDVSPIAIQSVVVTYLVTITAGLLFVGPLGDRFGRRQTLLAGLVIFVAASLLATVAPTLALLIAARALQGLGGAAMATMSIALVMDAFPPSQSGATLGVLSTTSALATMLAPSLGGVLVSTLGWRSLMALNVPLGLIAIALVARTLADTARTTSSARLFDPELLRNPRLRTGLTTSFIVATVMVSTLVVGPFVLAREMGLSFAAVGFVMAVGPLVSVLLAVQAGKLADRIGPRPTTLAALACLTFGAMALAFVVGRHNVIAYTAAIIVLSIGYAMFQTPNSSAVMAEAAPTRRATVSGLLTLSRNAGFIIGTGGIGGLFSATNATTAFGATAVLSAAALAVAGFAVRETLVP